MYHARVQRSDFHYDLPQDRIAQVPLAQRSASRLLVLDRMTGAFEDRGVRQLPALLAAGDLLVLNDTRVIPARVFGSKSSGGRVEILLERVVGEREALAHVRASKPVRPGLTIATPGGTI